jgi:hypothetical protein
MRFFRVAHFLCIDSDMLVVSASAAHTALERDELIRQAPTKAMLFMGQDTGSWRNEEMLT